MKKALRGNSIGTIYSLEGPRAVDGRILVIAFRNGYDNRFYEIKIKRKLCRSIYRHRQACDCIYGKCSVLQMACKVEEMATAEGDQHCSNGDEERGEAHYQLHWQVMVKV